jgi:hypothetical protein
LLVLPDAGLTITDRRDDADRRDAAGSARGSKMADAPAATDEDDVALFGRLPA